LTRIPCMTRRALLNIVAGFAVALVAGKRAFAVASASGPSAQHYEFELTDAQWRARLTPEQYAVLRKGATEFAFSSPLDGEHRIGTYLCAGCELALFSSKTKFDSGTGWPSFWAPLPEAIATSVDTSFMDTVTEVHCRRCGGHLGHVFPDGPKPTGLRYCMNGVALVFKPKTS
jgi:peptide-methionine (R)-S-oxide reductase